MNGDLASEFTNIYNQDTKNEPKNMKHSGLNLIQYVYIYIYLLCLGVVSLFIEWNEIPNGNG